MIKKNSGFTFIEMIIATTIFSIIAVSIYSTIRAGTRIWLRSNSIIEVNQGMRIFFDMVSLDLKNVIIYYSTADEGRTNFVGEPNKISFMTLVNVSGQGQSLHQELAKVVYYLDTSKTDPTKKAITKKLATKDTGFNEDDTNAKEATLVDGVNENDFGFEYCYKDMLSGDEYTYKWENIWKDASKIPRAVKIKVKIKSDEFTKIVLIPTGELISEE